MDAHIQAPWGGELDPATARVFDRYWTDPGLLISPQELADLLLLSMGDVTASLELMNENLALSQLLYVRPSGETAWELWGRMDPAAVAARASHLDTPAWDLLAGEPLLPTRGHESAFKMGFHAGLDFFASDIEALDVEGLEMFQAEFMKMRTSLDTWLDDDSARPADAPGLPPVFSSQVRIFLDDGEEAGNGIMPNQLSGVCERRCVVAVSCAPSEGTPEEPDGFEPNELEAAVLREVARLEMEGTAATAAQVALTLELAPALVEEVLLTLRHHGFTTGSGAPLGADVSDGVQRA